MTPPPASALLDLSSPEGFTIPLPVRAPRRAAERDIAVPPARQDHLSEVVSRRRMMADTLALVLAGGRGTRLGNLTTGRAKPAVPIAGRHRIIDFTLSNCINSGLSRVGVLTQYMADSLHPHLEAWNAASGDFAVRTLAADGDDQYRGTADAIFQNLGLIRTLAPSYVLVLAADHVYRMDYAAMLSEHIQRRAQLTIGCVEVPIAEAGSFGVMSLDAEDRIVAFAEKPQSPQPLPDDPDAALASMGIYIFDTGFLIKALTEDALNPDSAHDFGKDVIPAAIASARTFAFRLRDLNRPWRDGYWRDVGTIDAYWRTNLELIGDSAALRIDDRAWPIQSLARDGSLPAAADGRANCRTRWGDSIVADGCCIEDAEVSRSVLFDDVCIGSGSRLDGCVVLPGARIGAGCRLRNTIVGEGCTIPDGCSTGIDPEEDRRRFAVTPGGVVLVS